MIRNYLLVSLKVLMRKKFFTFVSLFGISFTLAVLMAGTAFLDHFTAPHPPESQLDRTLYARTTELKGERNHIISSLSWHVIETYMKRMETPELISVTKRPQELPVFVGDRKLMLSVRHTDTNFWTMRSFQFVEGGAFTEADLENGNPVAVINQRTRDEYFGGDGVVGKWLEVDGIRYRVAGVVRNVPLTQEESYGDLWAPLSVARFDRKEVRFFGDFMVSILARSRDDFPRIRDEWKGILAQVDLSSSRRELKEIWIPIMTRPEYVSTNMKMSMGLTDHYEESNVVVFYLALLAGMLLFMLLPTINLVNINLSRIMERSSEIGVRKAFGASRQFLVGQFVTENVVLTLIGGALGFVFSWVLLRWVESSGLIPDAHFSLNLRVFALSFVICLFFGVFSGVYPAWRMSRLHPVDALRGGVS